MNDNVITLPSSVKTFDVDNDTLQYFHFDCKERMGNVTLRIDESVSSDIVMGLPEMKELNLPKTGSWSSVDDYPSLCNHINTIHTSHTWPG